MFLGLDLGTSGLRALLTDEADQVLAVGVGTYPISHPSPGWSEQDPEAWIAACRTAVAEIRAKVPRALSSLKGIAVSGQMHGSTLLDADGAVLRPCILWNDTRSQVEAAELDGDPEFRAVSGNIVFPGFTAPKLVWVARHEPEVFRRVAKVLLPKDYLNFWLTGTYSGDMSDSAGTSWLDVAARGWSPSLLEKSGMRPDQMPGLVEGSSPAGTLRKELAEEWGVSGPVVVAGGGGDNAAAACGVGALRAGDAFVSLGTSGVLLAARDSFTPKPESAVHTFCHAVPGRWYQMGVILAATDSLNWLAGLFREDAGAMTKGLGNRAEAPADLIFLPYLSGERTPHNDGAVRGVFAGLDIAHGRKDLTLAVLEGVSFALRDNLEALRSTGAEIDRLLAIGGGSKSAYWVDLLANVLGVPVDLPAAGELGAALGAARLARCAATGADPDDVMTKPAVSRTVEPRADLVAACEHSYGRYRAAYPAIKAIP